VTFSTQRKQPPATKQQPLKMALNIGIGDTNYCTTEIIELFSFVETPDGFILPQKTANDLVKEIVIKTANTEESR